MKRVGGDVVAVPKFEYVRSPALMKAYRLLPCQHCGRGDGTIAGAHSNWSEHGKGRGIKASDICCASLCFTCHSWLDAGGAQDYLKRVMWDEAHSKTIDGLIKLSQGTGKQAQKLRETLRSVGLVK